MIATSGGIIYKDMGSNKAMWTEAFLEDDGRCHGYTRTATFTWFGGYHGGMIVLVMDANMIVLDQTPKQTFGVDGRWIGNSDRTDHWSFQLDLGVVGGATHLQPWHFWDPQWQALRQFLEIGKQVAPAILALL